MKRLLFYFTILSFISGCREKFYADLPSPATGYLIVEGIISLGNEVVTGINLSRTTPLDSDDINPEENATVYIEDRLNRQYALSRTGSGRYESQPLDLPLNEQYRLHIFAGGKEYYSAFTDSKISPPIDSLYWVPKAEGIEIQLNTHDAQSLSKYYYWSFVETWEYSVPYYALLKYIPATNEVDYRGPGDPQIYSCWSTLNSFNIIIASTAKLSQDLVYAKPINFISATNSNKLFEKYSIIVKQSVLPKDAYEYLDRIRKNTEQVGSIFDAQPSQLRGNIRCVSDSSEIVVGFISTSSITEKRIFIKRSEIPPFKIPTFYESCMRDTIRFNPDSLRDAFASGSNLPIDYWRTETGIIQAVVSGPDYCVDCRERGGTNIRPSFW